jgi:glycosyltransferase involved in cell wall biosynthesis
MKICKLSIITINLNNFEGLKRTVESVISQTWKEFEYIIIDGGSTDGSVEYIAEIQDHIAYWVSEIDNGIFHAMNKGIRNAKGEYLFFLNSGDCIADTRVLEKVICEIDLVNGHNCKQNIFLGSTKQIGNELWFSPPETVTLHHLYKSALPHQGLFLPLNLAVKFPFSEDYKIVSDWIQTVELLLSGTAEFKKLKQQELISINEAFGVSATANTQIEKEKYMAEKGSSFRRIEDYGMLRNKYDRIKNVSSANILNRILWKLMVLSAKRFKNVI